MLSDKEGYAWYVKQLKTPNWMREMPHEMFVTIRHYLSFVLSLKNKAIKKLSILLVLLIGLCSCESVTVVTDDIPATDVVLMRGQIHVINGVRYYYYDGWYYRPHYRNDLRYYHRSSRLPRVHRPDVKPSRPRRH